MAAGTAVIGSFQFGYNTGVINAPQSVSITKSTAGFISENSLGQYLTRMCMNKVMFLTVHSHVIVYPKKKYQVLQTELRTILYLNDRTLFFFLVEQWEIHCSTVLVVL